ncbi:TPA: hypothetical protein ACWXSR_005194, partial [Escherichia coli]|uniref:hypothetical protein n=1 Tax=Escherichia coli TaxID=562 RepID=UPI002263F6A6
LTHLTGICRSFFIPTSPEGEQSTVHSSLYIPRTNMNLVTRKHKLNRKTQRTFYPPPDITCRIHIEQKIS